MLKMKENWPSTLRGEHIVLEPLELEHYQELKTISTNPKIWVYMALNLSDPKAFDDYFLKALLASKEFRTLPFAIRLLKTDCIVGYISLGDIQLHHESVRPVGTWVHVDYWGTVVSSEARLLSFKFAFEKLGVKRMWANVDSQNTRNCELFRKMGAIQEGVFRSHRFRNDGSRRDSNLFSILSDEWPVVEQNLMKRIDARTPQRNNS